MAKHFIEVDGDLVCATRAVLFATKADAEKFVKEHYPDAESVRYVPQKETETEHFEHGSA